MKYYVVKTLGCKANFYDSQLIEAELQKRGWRAAQGDVSPALCIVNSCTVTDEADRQTRKMAARMGREHPEARIVVTGCAAEVDPERLANSKGIHYVIGNREKPRLVDLILERLETPLEKAGSELLGLTEGYEEMVSRHPTEREWPVVESVFSVPPVHLDGNSGKTRAFLKIQEGCNSFCTYCIIPYGRGPSRSLRPREVIDQVRKLVAEGIREIVITGTNIGDFGTDWGAEDALTELLTLVFTETDLERLRVSSLDPTEITDRMIALMEREKRFCPHFHVSLQSPDSRILRLMKRKYGFDRVKERLERIAAIPSPVGGVFVGMDVITGFPGETQADFQATVATLEALPWSRLHVFPYSERAGTPATRLGGSVPKDERLERTRVLNRLSLDRMVRIHTRILEQCQASGQPLTEILLEKPGQKAGAEAYPVPGYTKNYIRALLPTASGSRNQLVSAVPIGLRTDPASGEVALECRPR